MNELMMNSVAANPELSAIAKTIDEAAERGAQLAQRMLAFARRQRLEARTLQLNDTVGSIAAMLKPTLGEHIRIDVELCEGLWPALADPSQLENAIINLAVNARDAMPNGGRLVIETGNVHLDEHYAAQNADVVVGDYVAVIVTDSGTGMRPEVIERAFEPFFTTKDVGYGTGLGLSTVYGFAKQSRGHVKIYSELGHGTSVKLYLPRSEGTQVEAISSGRQVAQARGRENILVVEDEASVRKVAVSILENLGYCVQQAGDGWEALAILGKPGCVDLLFTDMVMPNGLGGEELLQKARELRPGLKALFTSGYSEKFLRNQRRTAPDVAVLNKPYRKDTLANAIRTALG
jgi:CheY-like chemotaxis protein